MIKKKRRIFDCDNKNWSSNPEYNETFLKVLQNQLTDQLQKRGYLYLNEVWDCLGFKETFEGQLIGWIYNPEDPTKANRVDFGVSNYEGESIVLNFSVDSIVFTERFYKGKTKKLYFNNVDEHSFTCCVDCPFKDLHNKAFETETT